MTPIDPQDYAARIKRTEDEIDQLAFTGKDSFADPKDAVKQAEAEVAYERGLEETLKNIPDGVFPPDLTEAVTLLVGAVQSVTSDHAKWLTFDASGLADVLDHWAKALQTPVARDLKQVIKRFYEQKAAVKLWDHSQAPATEDVTALEALRTKLSTPDPVYSQVDGHQLTEEEIEERSKADAAAYYGTFHSERTPVYGSPEPEPMAQWEIDLLTETKDDPEIAYTPESPFGEPTNYQERALEVVRGWMRTNGITPNVYVVWFAKTLQNYKALISTDELTGFYFEVTYNGDKNEHYLDVYVKQENLVILDPEKEKQDSKEFQFEKAFTDLREALPTFDVGLQRRLGPLLTYVAAGGSHLETGDFEEMVKLRDEILLKMPLKDLSEATNHQIYVILDEIAARARSVR